jgi:UDP-2-acetamido-2-deoxy-ribo-hexuluronate aminotransferase
MQFIDLKAQYAQLQHLIDARIRAVLEHGQFIMGPEIAELESALADYVGVRHCITVSSGTHSLEIAMRALKIGPGDEVITVPFTWISSSETISLVGARPVFVDIDPSTFNIDVDQIRSRITARTKAILPVSLFGQMPDMAELDRIANEFGIVVIEDAAQSFGSTQDGRKSCSLSRIASTSFFPAKPLGCYGDGGALFTNDDELAINMRAIRTHGGTKRHHHTLIGTNGRMDTLQAAVVLAKFPTFPWEVQQRSELGAIYAQLLSDCCVVPAVRPGNSHVYAQYTIRASNRDGLAADLKSAGIPSAVYYPKCLHEQPVYQDLGYSYGDFPHSEQASREVLSLPMHPYLTMADLERVADVVRSSAHASKITLD